MNNYSAYLFDLDGTVYAGVRPIQSTIDYINHLVKNHKKVFMVTNNATVSESMVKLKLEKFGVDVKDIEVATSAMATAFSLQKRQVQNAYIIGEQVLLDVCLQAGIKNVEMNVEAAEAVILGLNRDATYNDLAQAAEIIQKSDVPFFATNYDLRLAQADYFLPGAGTLVNVVEQASLKRAEVCGKPFSAMSEYLSARLGNISKDKWLMIGDNYDTDILFGINNGFDTCFIETGVHQRDYLINKKQPTYILSDLSEVAKN